MNNIFAIQTVLFGTIVMFQAAFAQPHTPPPKPAVTPLIGMRYGNDADGDRIDDQLFARARNAAAAEKNALTPAEKAKARAVLAERVNVELIFKEPVTQRQIDTFIALGGEITYFYKAVSYGWNARLPLEKVSAAPAAMGATLALVTESRRSEGQMDTATRTGRVRPVWAAGFAGNPAGFSGNTNTTIAVLDTGVDESHADLNGRRVYWHDFTASGYGNPVDYNSHGSHVTGIAVGTGVMGGSGTGPLKFTHIDNLIVKSNGGFLTKTMDLPTNSVTVTATARWNGGPAAGTRLHWAYRLKTASPGTWNSLGSVVGTSPLTLNLALIGQPDRVYSDALIQSNGISDFVVMYQVTSYPGLGDGFNKLRGVAPGCNWAGAKVLDDAGHGFNSDIGAAVDDLVANRALYNIKVMNLSLGGITDPALRQKINTAVNNGIVMAVAVGNRPAAYGTNVLDPARAALALSVAAANDLNQLTEYSSEGFLSPGSSPGQEEDYKPDLIAPGGSYYYSHLASVDSNSGDGPFAEQQSDDYANHYGTSMATPFAAASAALVIQALENTGVTWDFNSSQHARFIKMVLCATASESNTNREGNLSNPTLQRANSITNGSEILPSGKDLYEGYGNLNPDAAIQAVALSYTNGTLAIASLGPSTTDPRAWARKVTLFGGRNFSVSLANPTGGDFDLYLYSAVPSAFGTPVLLASSTHPGNGIGESLNYTADSDQSVLLVVKRVSGSGTFNLMGNAAPAADFAADATSGLAPLTVTFTNLTIGDATNFLWSFGDGNSSTSKDATNTYLNAGTYTVTLSASGPGGTNSFTKPALIVVTNPPPPVVAFTGTPTEGQWPLYVSFSNATIGAMSNFWQFGDGNSSTTKEPVNIYASAGKYSVTLTAVGPGGTGSLTLAGYINVTNPPVPDADFTAAPTAGLAPLTVSFTGIGTGGTNYNYDFGDGETGIFKNTSHTYRNAGIYSVTFTVVGPGGTNSLTKPRLIVVTNEPMPIADFAISPIPWLGGVTNGYVPLSVVFNNLSTHAASFLWDFGDGHTSTDSGYDTNAPGVIHTYDLPGIYTVSLAAMAAGGTNSLSRSNYITANPPPMLLSPEINGTDFIFSFETLPGATYVYRIDSSDSPGGPNWTSGTPTQGDGTLKTVTNGILALPEQFYRLSVWINTNSTPP